MSRWGLLAVLCLASCGSEVSSPDSDAASGVTEDVLVSDAAQSVPDVTEGLADTAQVQDADTATAVAAPVLGTVAEVGDCQVGAQQAAQGYTCETVEVSCPDLPPLAVDLVVAPPAVEQRGVAVLGSGGGGTTFYNATVMQQLAAAGFRVINRKWHSEWTAGTVGMGGSACRYATLVTWIRAQPWSEGPLCVSGNSGGSAEIAYVLGHWERGEVLDLAVLSGGPPMARLDLVCPADSAWVQACTDVVPEAICGGVVNCAYNAGNYALVDGAFEGTPCTDGEPLGLLRTHSILSEDARTHFPDTALHVIQGDEDCTSASPQGYLYTDAITSDLILEVAQAPHGVFQTEDGAARIVAAFEAGCVCRHALCLPTP